MAASLDALDPDLRDAAQSLVDAAGSAGLLPRITSTLRTHSEQRRLYSRFLAGQSGFPAAPPGQSAHEYGYAFDLVVSPMEALADVGYTWQSWGGGWNPSDAVHFELLGAAAWAKTQPALDIGESFGARASGLITTATDFWIGSNVAGLLRMIPGLSKSEALEVLSQPYESFQKWLITSISLPGFRR